MTDKEKVLVYVCLITTLLLGFAIGFGFRQSIFNDFLEENVCMTSDNYESIISVFFYCNNYYDDAQKWWNSNPENFWDLLNCSEVLEK